jgi:hypothetical protein
MVVGAVGGTLIDFVKALIILLPQFDPLIAQATRGIAELGPAVVKWASSQKTADGITKFMAWFSQNGPAVGGLLKNIGGALKALAPGIGPASVAELNAFSMFFGLIAKLPPGLAKPLTEVAASLLILNKLGVLKVGLAISAKAGGAFAGTALGKALLGGATAGSLILPVTLAVGAIAGLSQIHDKTGGGTLLAPKASDLGFNGRWMHDILQWYSDLNKGVFTLTDYLRHHVANIYDSLRHDIAGIWDGILKYLTLIGLEIEKTLLISFGDLSNRVLNIIGGMINGLAKAFGWLPFGVQQPEERRQELRQLAQPFQQRHR